MMLTDVFPFFLALVALATSVESQLTIKLDSSLVESNREWSRVKLDVEGGVGPYTIRYDSYPDNWKQVINGLYAPRKQLQENRKYPCRVRVKDGEGKKLRATVVFIVKNRRLKIARTLYPYGKEFQDQFYEEDGCSGKPKLIFRQERSTRLKRMIKAARQTKYEAATTKQLKQINQISQMPGSGLAELIQQISDNHQKFSLTNLINNLRKTHQAEGIVVEEQAYSFYSKQEINADQSTGTRYHSSFRSHLPSPSPSPQLPPISPTPLHFDQPLIADVQKQAKAADATTQQLSIIAQIDRNEAQATSQTKSIEQIFLKLPSSAQLDQIILTSDSLAILKTIQAVVRSDLQCEEKISYLYDFFGRIRSAVQMKTFALNQLEVIIETARIEIEVLQKQITVNDNLIAELGVDSLKSKLMDELFKLQLAYNDFNAVDSQIEPNQQNAQSLADQILVIQGKSDQERQLIIQQKLTLSEIQAEIKGLQTKLHEAHSRRKSTQTSITSRQEKVRAYEKKIQEIQNQINKLEIFIDELEAKSDQKKQVYKNLEIAIERIRDDVIRNEKKEDQLYVQIQELKERIFIEEKKLATQQLEKLQYMVDSLLRSLPSVQGQIDTSYYNCYSLSDIQSQTEGTTLVYYIGNKNFQKYLENSYGNIQVQAISLSGTVTVTPLTILDPTWVAAFGDPYQDSQIAVNKEFSFNEDFNCLNPSTLVSGYGQISRISSKLIFAKDQTGKEIKLKLGACSRLELTKGIPNISEKIYWRGSPDHNGYINIYRASCL